MRVRGKLLSGLLLVVFAAALAGCGEDTGTRPSGGSISEEFDFSGPQNTAQFTVGSESFTEQEVLGEITLQALEATGADITDRTGLGGNEEVRQALLSDEVDIYWEYTATGWLVFLANENPISDPAEQYRAIAEEDLRQNDVEWLPPAPANNAYAIAASEETASDLGVQTISDLARLVEERPDEANLCFGNENDFRSRIDGLPGLEQAYNFEFPDENLIITPLDTVYRLVSQGERCNFGVVFLTSGFLTEFDNLQLLEDDENFFAIYNPSPTMKSDTLDEYPQLNELFAPITAELDTETLRSLNYAVEVEGRPIEDVAREWLQENGFIG